MASGDPAFRRKGTQGWELQGRANSGIGRSILQCWQEQRLRAHVEDVVSVENGFQSVPVPSRFVVRVMSCISEWVTDERPVVAGSDGTGKAHVVNETESRRQRNADLDAAARSGPYTIVKRVTLSKDKEKFVSWISGVRGHNGWELTGPKGTRHTTGKQTVKDLVDRGAITNPEALRGA